MTCISPNCSTSKNKRQLNSCLLFLLCAEFPEDNGEGDGEGDGEEVAEEEEEEDDDQGEEEGEEEADVPLEEDEGRDSGGYYEEEEAEAEHEPSGIQTTSDLGHSMPDFTADVDINKSEMETANQMAEEETKPEPMPEDKQGMHIWLSIFLFCR